MCSVCLLYCLSNLSHWKPWCVTLKCSMYHPVYVCYIWQLLLIFTWWFNFPVDEPLNRGIWNLLWWKKCNTIYVTCKQNNVCAESCRHSSGSNLNGCVCEGTETCLTLPGLSRSSCLCCVSIQYQNSLIPVTLGHCSLTECSTRGWVTHRNFCCCKACWRWCVGTRCFLWYKRVEKSYWQDFVASNGNFLTCCILHEAAEPSFRSPALRPDCEMIL